MPFKKSMSEDTVTLMIQYQEAQKEIQKLKQEIEKLRKENEHLKSLYNDDGK